MGLVKEEGSVEVAWYATLNMGARGSLFLERGRRDQRQLGASVPLKYEECLSSKLTHFSSLCGGNATMKDVAPKIFIFVIVFIVVAITTVSIISVTYQLSVSCTYC